MVCLSFLQVMTKIPSFLYGSSLCVGNRCKLATASRNLATDSPNVIPAVCFLSSKQLCPQVAQISVTLQVFQVQSLKRFLVSTSRVFSQWTEVCALQFGYLQAWQKYCVSTLLKILSTSSSRCLVSAINVAFLTRLFATTGCILRPPHPGIAHGGHWHS